MPSQKLRVHPLALSQRGSRTLLKLGAPLLLPGSRLDCILLVKQQTPKKSFFWRLASTDLRGPVKVFFEARTPSLSSAVFAVPARLHLIDFVAQRANPSSRSSQRAEPSAFVDRKLCSAPLQPKLRTCRCLKSSRGSVKSTEPRARVLHVGFFQAECLAWAPTFIR